MPPDIPNFKMLFPPHSEQKNHRPHPRYAVRQDRVETESVRAKLRVPANYGYPPDIQEKVAETALRQAEALSVERAIA